MRSLRGFRLFLVVLLSTSLFVSIVSLTPYTLTPQVLASPSISVFPTSAPHGYGRACLPGVPPFNSANCNPPPGATTPPSSSQAVVQISGSGFSGSLGTGTHGLGYTCSLFAFGPGTLFDNNPNRTACRITNTGTVIANFSVSPTAAQGGYTLNVTDFSQPYYSSGTTLNTQRSATTTFTVSANPSITLSTNSASPTSTVSITGSGFANGISSNPDQGSCTMNSAASAMNITTNVSCFIDSSGNLYSTQFTVLNTAAAGGYQINVTGSHGDYALIGFVVSSFSFTLNPIRAQPGQTVVVSGTGATASKGTSCSVTSDNPNLVTSASVSVVDNIGHVAGSFVVGSTAAGKAGGNIFNVINQNNVTLSCGSSNTAYAGFSVIPKITLNPTAGSGNQTVSITGGGFRSDVTSCQVSDPFLLTALTSETSPASKHTFAQSAVCSVTGTGTISATFIVNATAKNGPWNITVSGYVPTGSPNNITSAFAVYFKVQGPFISVSPNATAPGYGTLDGTAITVSGGGFPTGSSRSCTLSAQFGAAIFATSPAISCTISGSGTVTGSFAVAPSASPGNYTILVTDQTSQPFPPTFPSAQTTFRVNGLVNVTLTQTTGPAGTLVTILTGKKFTAAFPGFQPTFDAGTCTISSTPSNIISSPVCFIAANGSLVGPTQFVVSTVGAGGYTIQVTGLHGDYGLAIFILTATSALTINPSLGSPPLGSLPGTSVSITGSGFSPSDTSCTITSSPNNLTMPGFISSLACSASGGSLSATFIVGAGATNGTYTLTVKGTPVFDTQTVKFSIIPRIALNPALGTNGTLVSVSGSGFRGTVGTTACASITATPSTLFPTSPTPTCIKNADGTVTATFVVAPRLSNQGGYLVTVNGTDSTFATRPDLASTGFVVGARLLIVTPSIGTAGIFVNVTGTNFYTNDTMCMLTSPTTSLYVASTNLCSITNGVVQASFQVAATNVALPGVYSLKVQGSSTGDTGYGFFTVAVLVTTTTTSTSITSTSSASTTTTTLTTTTQLLTSLTTTTFQTTGVSTATSRTFTTTTTTGISTSTSFTSAISTTLSGTSTTLTTVTTILTKTFGQIIRSSEQKGPYFDELGLLAILIVLGPWVLRRLLD